MCTADRLTPTPEAWALAQREARIHGYHGGADRVSFAAGWYAARASHTDHPDDYAKGGVMSGSVNPDDVRVTRRVREVQVVADLGGGGGNGAAPGLPLRNLERLCEELRAAGAGGEEFVRLTRGVGGSWQMTATVAQPWRPLVEVRSALTDETSS